jgi:hypothetical protein
MSSILKRNGFLGNWFCRAFYFGALIASPSLSFSAELPVEEAILTFAPEVPPPISRTENAKVKVHLEVKEVVTIQHNYFQFLSFFS